ncbi:MAG TPA: monovalent cation:proton antiporter-2 (CPA2) family protein [Thiobacillus sp.]|nr:MAG: potassium transporter [Hydrogenophilales bacterium 12-64-13]OYZ06123.1 MAG: potassium transporter [Hydrogenophilales bacterium 16-64-46]OZA38978.1 MAG: potassium transporter [Hydrogenophilales bacterium 17-64-34]HQS82730.1 monovalent cation:proton antiporter-2 (CPA2) family protein [Thiobacillus sp.]HQT01275.1 monovalent cation:proton antiporter-2 (CPA2) family protein [Thiobacillus sp.]
MHSSLQLVLILLAVAVLVAAAARALRLPTMLGYLVTGIAIGPFALGWIPDSEGARYLAEFGVVFLMFSIGLEFSLPRLMTMRMTVFGFGGAQVGLTILFTALIAWLLDLPLLAAVALGGIMSMSSTAIVSKLLAERLEIQTPHGRQIFGALLFQDLAVVPLLILIPAFARESETMATDLMLAMLKAIAVLGFLLFIGQRIMRPWFQWVAGRKSPELFTLNLLLFTLGLAFLTESAGLSLALGAFLAGMLVSETEYRYQVEDDIKPFRDVLLGLFFVTIGMRLDLTQVLANWGDVLILVAAIVLGKGLLVAGLSMAFGSARPTATRTALGLAQAGEFGFVLLAQAADLRLLGAEITQPVLAAMVVSMLLAPILINRMDSLTRVLAGSEWAGRAKEVHDIAVKTFGKTKHVIVCGYGRSGQNLARLLEAEGITFVALDADPERIRAVAASGVSVVYGDASRREVLVAAGLSRAQAVVVTYSDLHSSMAILRHVRELRPELPVVVRTIDDTHIDDLKAAGAAEVVSEVMEGSLMLASHALMLLGVPLSQVLKRIRVVRESRYAMMRGFFRGASDADDELDAHAQPRLHTVLVTQGAAAAGHSLDELALDELLVEVAAIRRQGQQGVDPVPDARIEVGDVLVLRGAADGLAAAEFRILQG